MYYNNDNLIKSNLFIELRKNFYSNGVIFKNMNIFNIIKFTFISEGV